MIKKKWQKFLNLKLNVLCSCWSRYPSFKGGQQLSIAIYSQNFYEKFFFKYQGIFKHSNIKWFHYWRLFRSVSEITSNTRSGSKCQTGRWKQKIMIDSWSWIHRRLILCVNFTNTKDNLTGYLKKTFFFFHLPFLKLRYNNL